MRKSSSSATKTTRRGWTWKWGAFPPSESAPGPIAKAGSTTSSESPSASSSARTPLPRSTLRNAESDLIQSIITPWQPQTLCIHHHTRLTPQFNEEKLRTGESSDVPSFTVLGQLNRGSIEVIARFLLPLQQRQDQLLFVEVVEGNLLRNDHSDEQANSPHKYPERHSQEYLHLHEEESEDVERNPHQVVPNAHVVPQVVVTFSLLLSAKLPHHGDDAVDLDGCSDSHHHCADHSDALEFLEDGLAEDVVGQADGLGEVGVGLVVGDIHLFAVEEVDVEGEVALDHQVRLLLVEHVEGHLDAPPVVVRHGEDQGEEGQQVHQRSQQQTVSHNIM